MGRATSNRYNVVADVKKSEQFSQIVKVETIQSDFSDQR